MSQIELLVLRPGAAERRLVLAPGVAHVGRAEDNQVVLADVGVSRRHARLEVVGSSVVVEDLGSGNGTWFKGRPIKRQVLGPGEEVFIDPFTLRVAATQAREPVEITAGRDATVPLKSAPAQAMLTVTSAHKMPRRDFPLPSEGSITVGRSDKNAIVLPEPASSRVHAEIVAEGTGWLVRDFGSSNGTFVNGRRIKERHLDDGDRIRIGTVELRFSLVHEVEGTEAFSDAIVSAPNAARPLPPPPPLPPPTSSIPIAPRPAGPFAVSIPEPEPAAPPPWPAPSGPPPMPTPGPSHGAQTDPGSPPPPFRPNAGGGAVELDLDPRRARGRKLATTRKSGGFLSRPINQVSLGILTITFLIVAGKVASEILTSMLRPSPAEPVVAAAPAAPAPAVPAPVAPTPPVVAAPASTDPALPAPLPPTPPAPVPLPAAAPSATANPAATEPMMAEGMTAFAEGRYFDAAGAFYRVLQVDPNHQDARRMGYVACEFITLAEARSALVQRTTTEAARSAAKAEALTAVAAVQAGSLPVADARPKVEAALAMTPDDPELLAARKELDGKAASVARAVSAGKAAAQTKDLQAKLTAAQAELDKGRLSKAVRGFEAVMAADPTHSTPEYYQAQEGAQAARDRMRTESKAAWADANAAIKVEDWLTARKRLEEVVSIDPYNEAAATKLAEAKKRLKEGASEIYKEARVLEEMGQSEKALALYHKVQLYVGDESDPLYGKAQTRMDALLR